MSVIRDVKAVGAYLRSKRIRYRNKPVGDSEHVEQIEQQQVEYVQHHSRQTDDEIERMDKLTWRVYDGQRPLIDFGR